MKISYDEQTDTLSVILKDNTPVAESNEDKPGVILDYDATGNLVSLEILDASKRVTEARKVELRQQDKGKPGAEKLQTKTPLLCALQAA